MVDHLRGKSVPRRIDTGVTLVTPANIDSAGVKDLVTPPIEKYLAGR
jgi:ABC-type sugar transport system substrate-binding protein